ncbi:MAG TPA: transketolase [Patescibacteria group bacterium]|nr:transketolase [Patescibacteria group bacterium]
MNKTSLDKLTHLIRYYILTITTQAGSGHPSSSLSAVELMTVLFFKYLRYNLADPKDPGNDRVIFSKGHASPLYYSLYAAAGAITEEELMKYRTFDSNLEGHPTERFRYTEAATGSLGQGLSIGLGEALAMSLSYQGIGIRGYGENNNINPNTKYETPNTLPRVFILAGDGEIAEGSVWEAAAAASFKKINNLYLVVDVNRLGQSDPTMYEYELEIYQRRFEAFGWRVITVSDGNDVASVDSAWMEALGGKGPTVILAKTTKGKGVSFIENMPGWHGKPLSKEELEKAIAEIAPVDKKVRGIINKAPSVTVSLTLDKTKPTSPFYDPTKPVATRKAFGNALKRVGATDPHIVVVDGDVKNSTYTEFFGVAYPKRFFELFIAEQNMTGVAVGLSARGFHPVVSSFACFLTRAADQIRMAAFSGSSIIFNGSHAGVSIGEDGPSQMGLEDLALFRTVHGSTVLYPADAYATERLTEDALNTKGICYIRTTRPETSILYTQSDEFPVGGSKTHHANTKEIVTVVAAGITLFEALKAQEQLENDGVGIRVIDAYSVKPIDKKTLLTAAKETKAIIVVEDHYPEGGLGEAVASAIVGRSKIPFIHLAVNKTPRSGKAKELLDYEGIAAPDIIESVNAFVKVSK